MKQSFFQFREKIYQVEFGTNMGNPLSPLIAEVFMANFEMTLKEWGILPRIWHRYVDDIYAVVHMSEVNDILEILNGQFETIKFTCEQENDQKLPFLDLELQRKDNKIEVAVYHKPTTTMRTITSDSHCPIQHKQAAYHSAVHRLCKLPLSISNFKREYEYLKETARVNGYNPDLIDKLTKLHSKKVTRSNLSTFFSLREEEEEYSRVSMRFEPNITNKLKTKYRENGMEIVYRNECKLMNLLGSTKDKTPLLKKSGIYEIECGKCKKKYYGQTKRNIETRVKDHKSYIRLNQPNKSAIASHMIFECKENINIENVKLLQQVNDDRRLDAYEAHYIQCDNNALNLDRGNIESCLFSRI